MKKQKDKPGLENLGLDPLNFDPLGIDEEKEEQQQEERKESSWDKLMKFGMSLLLPFGKLKGCFTWVVKNTCIMLAAFGIPGFIIGLLSSVGVV